MTNHSRDKGRAGGPYARKVQAVAAYRRDVRLLDEIIKRGHLMDVNLVVYAAIPIFGTLKRIYGAIRCARGGDTFAAHPAIAPPGPASRGGP